MLYRYTMCTGTASPQCELACGCPCSVGGFGLGLSCHTLGTPTRLLVPHCCHPQQQPTPAKYECGLSQAFHCCPRVTEASAHSTRCDRLTQPRNFKCMQISKCYVLCQVNQMYNVHTQHKFHWCTNCTQNCVDRYISFYIS